MDGVDNVSDSVKAVENQKGDENQVGWKNDLNKKCNNKKPD